MFMKRYLSLVLIICGLLVIGKPVQAAEGRGALKSMVNQIRKLVREQNKLDRFYDRLSDEQKAALLDEMLTKGIALDDADADGLPDALEESAGGGVCDSDSDDDGMNDGDEHKDGTKPDDTDSDDDGIPDGDEEDEEEGEETP